MRSAASFAACLLAVSFLALSFSARSEALPIFDAHLHYSHDAWELVPVEQAIAILRKAGLKRALVSSADDEGQQRLYRAAPDLVIPVLRPYRRRGEIGTWFRDETVVSYLEKKLKENRYAAIGEYHIYGADVDLPVPRRMIELARKNNLFLHSHSDADAIERQFRQWPQARILWAHSGFDRPERVAEMLRKHGNLRCDLAFRTDFVSNNKIDSAWRAVFLEFPERFMVGTDSYTPERWHYIAEHADWSRKWLADLPRPVAERIAWKNGESLFGSFSQGH
jgi:predicted TIM-barrel fold metal-dependent hydrolase